MKKTICIILSLVLLLSCISTVSFEASAAPATLAVKDHNYTLVDENAKLALYIDKNSGDFAIVNQKTGTAWYTTPTDWETDMIAQGTTRDELTSKMTVKYLTESYSTPTIESNEASVITERQGKDWILTFFFKGTSTNFTIPVKLSLKSDYLEVELLIDKIKELGSSRVLYVQLFHGFGAAGLNDQGYILVPDGSGSLMEFNRGVLNSYEFGAEGEGNFYAPNPTEVADQSYFTNWNEPLRLPVYGMVKNGEAYLNVIESGAAVSELRAYISRYKNSYNSAFTCINVRDTQSRRSSTGTGGKGSYYTDELPENYISRLYLLDGADANYIGMAKQYRQFLIETTGMDAVKESVSNTLNITLYGAVKKAMHFLGIPYTGVDDLTTYKEAEALIDRLKADNVDKAYINYLGWAPGGLETTMSTEFSANKKLGNKKALQSLIDKANSIENYYLSFDVDMQAFYGGTSEIKKFRDSAYGLDSSPVTIFKSRVSAAGSLDKNSIAYQLIHPGHMLGYAEEFIANASEWEVKSFSFNSIGDTLYCAYNLLDVSTRDESAASMTSIYKAASEKAGESGIVSTKGGNGYAASYVDNIVEAPVYGSRNNISLQEVPFYHIVFRGYVNLAATPMNLDSEQDDLILKMAETGMSLYYLLMDDESTSFQDTEFTSSYACELDDHYDDMIASYNRLKPLYNAVGSSQIDNYQIISEDVKITTFSNGAKVYVNYGDAETTVNGVKIGAKDFTVVGGANA
ncbi:MAG: hypothetical protein IJ043_07665 [Clostridia bacterium]|nr:hypothetical protein [Clostridia bacterium]